MDWGIWLCHILYESIAKYREHTWKVHLVVPKCEKRAYAPRTESDIFSREMQKGAIYVFNLGDYETCLQVSLSVVIYIMHSTELHAPRQRPILLAQFNIGHVGHCCSSSNQVAYLHYVS